MIERGIGETRAALISDGRIVEARIMVDGVLRAGTVLAARLTSRGTGGRNAIATSQDGAEYLLPLAPSGVSEGAAIAIEVVRESIPGDEPWKRPLARLSARRTKRSDPLETATELPFPPTGVDVMEAAGWSDLLEQAASGIVEFAGGRLRISLTPAMVLIDVDGILPPAELAVAGARAAAEAIRRLGLGGSIGIDLPTVEGKAVRQAAAEAFDAILPQPYERTAVNGFGFMQIIRPRARPSLMEVYAGDRAAAEARALLRRGALDRRPGAKRLVAAPPVIICLERNPRWIEVLAAQVGGAIGLRRDPTLGIGAGHAEPFT